MNSDTVSIGALAVSAVGLLISVAGVGFSAAQSRHAAHSTAIATAQHFMIECRSLWSICDDAARDSGSDDRAFRVAVGNIMGHFEVIMTLLAEGAVQGKLRKLVEGTVRDYLDHMSQRGFESYVQALLDHDEVCENLKDFCVQRHSEFRYPSAVFNMLNLPRSSL